MELILTNCAFLPSPPPLQNSFSLLGEFDEGRFASMIPTYQSSSCSTKFLSHLVTIHHKYPQLVELNMAGNSNLDRCGLDHAQ